MMPARQMDMARAAWAGRLLGRLLVALLLLAGAATPAAAQTPPTPAIREPGTVPGVSAAAYVLVDLSTERVVAGRGLHDRLPVASLTKVMTAVVALEHGALSDEVTIEGRDLPGEASVGLKVGERLTLETLLYGMLMRSGNDAAAAVARAVGEKVAAERGLGRGNGLAVFLELMNEQASRLGMTNSRFANAHGLDAPGLYSSAYDLALLTQYALRNPSFVRMFEARSYPFRGGLWQNANRLLYQYDGIIGGKTGVENLAGLCLIEAAQRGDRRLVVVVLNAPQWYDDARALFDYGFSEGARQATDGPTPFRSPSPASGPTLQVRAVATPTAAAVSVQRAAPVEPLATTVPPAPAAGAEAPRPAYGAGDDTALRAATTAPAQSEPVDWSLAQQLGLGAVVLVALLGLIALGLRTLGLGPFAFGGRRRFAPPRADTPWRDYDFAAGGANGARRSPHPTPRGATPGDGAGGAARRRGARPGGRGPDPAPADDDALPAPPAGSPRRGRTDELALAHLAVALRYVGEARLTAAEDMFIKAIQAAPDYRFSRLPSFWEMGPGGFQALASAYIRCNRAIDARAVVGLGLVLYKGDPDLTALDAHLQAARRQVAALRVD